MFPNFPFNSPVLASCLINARPLPAHRPAVDDKATTWQMIGHCPVPISLTAYANFAAHLGAFFY